MKNGKNILLLICTMALVLVIGIFMGRNIGTGCVKLNDNDTAIQTPIIHSEKDYRLDINTATKAQLMDLPGIGEIIADRIIQYRTDYGSFASTDELLKVEGIGAGKLEQIEKLIQVGG